MLWFECGISSVAAADGYLIESREEGSADWKTETSLPLKVSDPYPVAGLEPGKSYRLVWSVGKINRGGHII